jgi:hypothetical protein
MANPLLIIELLRYIGTYIEENELKNLINSSKTYREIKRGLAYLRLNKDHSIKFAVDGEFQMKILNAHDSSRFQLALDLSETNFSQIRMVEANICFANIHTLSLRGCLLLPSLTTFQNIQSLDLSRCGEIKEVPSQLAAIPRINLSYCPKLVDVRGLATAKLVYLVCCPLLKDVSRLGNVEELYLSWNRQITDVSGLGNNKLVDLSFCSGIRNVEMLGKVQFLNLNYCLSVENLATIKGTVSFLTALNCPGF